MSTELERENRAVIRGLIGFGLGFPVGFAAFALYYYLVNRHGAFDRFEAAHSVLAIVLGVSVLALGGIPPIAGVWGLVQPDQEVGRYSGFDTNGARVRVGTSQLHWTKRSSVRWIAFGFAWAALIAGIEIAAAPRAVPAGPPAQATHR